MVSTNTLRRYSHCIGHHMISVEPCSASSRLVACSAPLRGPAGLDDACAQLEGSTYVMAEEARRIVFVLTRLARRAYREVLVGAIAHPSAVGSDAERCSDRSQSNTAASTTTNRSIPRRPLARSLRRLCVTRIAVGVTPASALHVHRRAGSRPARVGAHPAQHESSCFAFAGSGHEVRRICGWQAGADLDRAVS